MLTDIERIRAANFQKLRERSPEAFARAMKKLPSSLSSTLDAHPNASDGPTRIGDEASNEIERAFGLTNGWLSAAHPLKRMEEIRLDNFHMLIKDVPLRFSPRVADLKLRCALDRGTAHEGDTFIGDGVAADVEAAYGLEPGWLSKDHH